MGGIFLSSDLNNLLKYRKVVFIGDSNVRTYYKDMLCLHHQSEIIDQRILKAKMEGSVFDDILMNKGERTNGRHFREERQFVKNGYDFSFYFLTRVYNDYVEELLHRICSGKPPDVLIINSCLWDLARWGPYGVEEYQENLVTLARRLKKILPSKCIVIWLTSPPLASQPYGGFLLVQLEFLKYCLRFHVMEGNSYSSKVFSSYGFDVLDIHYHLRMQIHRRAKDGIHWTPTSVRYITNLILTHISIAWGATVPHRYDSHVIQRVIESTNNRELDKENGNEPHMIERKTEGKNKVQPIKKKLLGSVGAYVKEKRLAEAHKRIRAWKDGHCHRI